MYGKEGGWRGFIEGNDADDPILLGLEDCGIPQDKSSRLEVERPLGVGGTVLGAGDVATDSIAAGVSGSVEILAERIQLG